MFLRFRLMPLLYFYYHLKYYFDINRQLSLFYILFFTVNIDISFFA